MNKCCNCGKLVVAGEIVEVKIQAPMKSALRLGIQAALDMENVEFVPGTFRHIECPA